MAIGASEIGNLINRGKARLEAVAKFSGTQINAVAKSDALKSAGLTINKVGNEAVKYGQGKFEAAKPLVKQALNPNFDVKVADVPRPEAMAVPKAGEVTAAAVFKGQEKAKTRAEIIADDLMRANKDTYKDSLIKAKEQRADGTDLEQKIEGMLKGIGRDRNETGQRRREYDPDTKKRYEDAETHADRLSQYLTKEYKDLDDPVKKELRDRARKAIDQREDAFSKRLKELADPDAEIDKLLQQKDVRTITEGKFTKILEAQIRDAVGSAAENVNEEQLKKKLVDIDLAEAQRLRSQNADDLTRFNNGAVDATKLKELQDGQVQRTTRLDTNRNQITQLEKSILEVRAQGSSGDRDRKINEFKARIEALNGLVRADDAENELKTTLENLLKSLQTEQVRLQKDLLTKEEAVRVQGVSLTEAQDALGDSKRLQGKYEQRRVDQLDQLIGEAVGEYLNEQATGLRSVVENKLQTEQAKAEEQKQLAFRQEITNRYEYVLDRKNRFGSGHHTEVKTDNFQIKQDYQTLMGQGQEAYVNELKTYLHDRPDLAQMLDTQEGQQLAIQQLLAFKDGAGNGISKGDKVHILTDEKHQKWSQPLVAETVKNDTEAKQEMSEAKVVAAPNTPEYKRQVEDAVYNRPDFFSTIMFGSLVGGKLVSEVSDDDEQAA